MALSCWTFLTQNANLPKFHHGEQSKQSTEDIEEWGREFHLALTSAVIASSYAPIGKRKLLIHHYILKNGGTSLRI